MANQDHVSVCCGDCPLGDCDIISQRQRWVLNDTDIETLPGQDFVKGLPTGTIHETTVDEHYILNHLPALLQRYPITLTACPQLRGSRTAIGSVTHSNRPSIDRRRRSAPPQ